MMLNTSAVLLLLFLHYNIEYLTAFSPTYYHARTFSRQSNERRRRRRGDGSSSAFVLFLSSTSTTTTTASLIQEQQAIIDQPTTTTRILLEDSNSMTTIQQATTTAAVPPINLLSDFVFGSSSSSSSSLSFNVIHRKNAEYQRGLITIGFITLLFASNSPVLHAAFQGAHPPPVVVLNAAVSVIALVGLLLGGDKLESNTPLPQVVQEQLQKQQQQEQQEAKPSDAMTTMSTLHRPLQLPLWLHGGLELGLWKFLGTTANLYGLSLTSASHGAFLIQLTTLIVPVVQGIMGVAIPQRIQWSVVLALAGVVCFAMDPTGTTSAAVDNTSSSTLVLEGDALCVVAAGFYATYDLRLFTWGKRVVPRQLITTKIATQAFLSVALLLFVASYDSSGIMSSISFEEWWTTTTSSLSYSFNYMLVVPCVLWSGVAVNAVAPFLQVGGQQVVGPTRCQTIYASQPLWAALLSFVFLGETVGLQGLIGATAFLSALALAATAEAPDPNCPQTNCEV